MDVPDVLPEVLVELELTLWVRLVRSLNLSSYTLTEVSFW